MNKTLLQTVRFLQRKYSTVTRAKALGDGNIINDIENEKYKPKKHPGIINVKTVSLPDNVMRAIEKMCEDQPTKAIASTSQHLVNHLRARLPPIETEHFDNIKYRTFNCVLKKENKEDVPNDERFQQRIKDKVHFLVKQKVYNWTPVNYDAQNALLYLFGRSPAEYAVLMRIFKEISLRDENFKPKSLFDYGSGVGSVSWAAKEYWKKSIFEYFNVDISRDMNDLALSILQKSSKSSSNLLKGVFYRQFLPATNIIYDLVVSAYSLLELPSFENRMKTILNLWNKTGTYLVIVENGSNAGFKVVNEVRDFILKLNDESARGRVFSPCPHDLICPRFTADDDTPCNFEVTYHPLHITGRTVIQRERYSYVVLKKGPIEDPTKDWPRAVRETLVRSGHTVCRVCTSNGKLSEAVFSLKKNGKTLYHCARATKWGDRLPVSLQEIQTDNDNVCNEEENATSDNNDAVKANDKNSVD